jgi:FKBP-type peptidyl-prolyl cis-trans isomerase SlyD
MKATIQKDTVVGIHYTLRGSDSEILDSSDGGEPLLYLHGHGQIIPGLESELSGKAVGDKFNVVVGAKDGYGEYDDTLIMRLERKQFPKTADLEVGDMFEASIGDNGPMMIRITEIDGTTITVDGNHPLAGQELNFDVEVMTIRAATESELEHGHAHDGDGHHHH